MTHVRMVNLSVISLALVLGCGFVLTGRPTGGIDDSLVFLSNVFIALVAIVLLLLPFSGISRNVLGAGAMASLSMFVFIWSRPTLSLIYDVEIVQAGKGITDSAIYYTIWMAGLGILLLSMSFCLSGSIAGKISGFLSSCNRLVLPKPLRIFFIGMGVLFGMCFLAISVFKAKTYLSAGYFDAIANPNFHSHIFLFFISKNLILLWAFVGRSRRNFLIASGCWLVFSIGFLFLGLRGYFASYLILFLFVFNLFRRIKPVLLFLLLLVFLYGATLILEYRLGYPVASGFLAKIMSALYSQGASFEVVFGAVNFHDDITNCLDGSVTSELAFGDCVDIAREVGFSSGGFASSFFAEAYYMGFFVFLCLPILLGGCIRVLDVIAGNSEMVKGLNDKYFYGFFVLVSVVPNLVYFGRASVFDFIFKFATVSLICLVSIIVAKAARPYEVLSDSYVD